MIFIDFQGLPAANVYIIVYSFPRSSGQLSGWDLHWQLRNDLHDDRTFDFFWKKLFFPDIIGMQYIKSK